MCPILTLLERLSNLRSPHAEVVELVDTLASGASALRGVEVQVLFSAPDLRLAQSANANSRKRFRFSEDRVRLATLQSQNMTPTTANCEANGESGKTPRRGAGRPAPLCPLLHTNHSEDKQLRFRSTRCVIHPGNFLVSISCANDPSEVVTAVMICQSEKSNIRQVVQNHSAVTLT